MKLHLPLSLRRSLVALLTALAAAPAWAGVLTSDVDQVIYADFGQNRGRYSVTNVNALLNELNKDGVYIHYNNGQDAYKLEHGMISFESRQEAGGSSAAINYNFIATVQHNGEQNPYFSYLELGGEKHAIQYKGIEYRGPYGGAFLHDKSGRDFKITRLNKIVTDVTTSSVYSVEKLKEEGLAGKLMYHSGGGRTFIYDPDTETYLPMENPDDSNNVNGTLGHFIQGAIQKIDSMGGPADGGFWFYHTVDGWNLDTDPLPFGTQSGDSGSPVWVWDDDAKEYKYIAAVQQSGDNPAYGASMSNLTYMQEVADSYDKVVESSQSVISIGSTENTHQTISQDSVSTTLWQGKVTDAGGILASFTGVEQGKSTWNDMVAIRDEDNWYALTQNYLNARQNNTDDSSLDYADLFMTDNLVFNAKDRTDYTIQVNSVVDTGIGYTEFTKGNQDKASYTISGSGYLDSAGYIIGEDVEVHLQLLSSDKTREVRKIGDGTLYIDGTGKNDIMLNLGGKGKTILNQSEGYAAYNVLANNGTTVQLLGGISQIKRDFTFGNGGATLDFHGNDWTEGAEGHFSMKALTQDAVITNSSDRTIQLNFTKGGNWLGSFADTAKAGIQVNYLGTDIWELNSIHTHLQHKDSGLTVSDGHVIFQGTITEHGISQLIYPEKNANGWNEAMCWQKENDWHYADARMNVTVDKGVFELGSHARLTGTVTVNSNASYIMREGVQNRFEYIEGGYTLEDTYAISSFYGHKGNTVLNGGTLQVEFSEGTTSKLEYSGNISGTGNMTVNTADGTLILSGENTFSGSKQLLNGHVIADDVSALGKGEGWQLDAGTTLTVQSGLTCGNALDYVNKSKSTGLLVLTEDMEQALDLSGSSLIIGAEQGKVVQYGSADDTISATNLGGGGGTLVVNAKLTGEQNLVLGRSGATGVVRLNNANKDYSGTISWAGAIALDYTTIDALGNAVIDLSYGGGMLLRGELDSVKPYIKEGSRGALLLDAYNSNTIDMSGMGEISLSAYKDATINGITVGNGESYRLGGHLGTLYLGKDAVTDSNSMLVDAKGNQGGKVVLAAQSNYTGSVTVQDTSAGKTGSVTLAFSENDALSKASSIVVDDGGVLDVGSTRQTLNNLQVKAGGLLTSGEGGTLVFNMTSEKFQYGSMRLDNAEKTGSANLVLDSADNVWNLFTVKEGILFTRKDNALSATGITRVETGATLNLNTWNGDGYKTRTMHGNIQLADKATMTTGTGDFDVTLTGTFTVDAASSAEMTGGKWHLTGDEYNKNGGTIQFASTSLRLDSVDAQYVGGTISVESDTGFFSSQHATDMVKQFNHVNIATGKKLTLDEDQWNTIWKLDKLTGSGNLVWESNTAHSSTARVIIGGNGDFSGQINVNRAFDQSARTHQTYLELTSEKAASNALINFWGRAANDNITLAVNADRVKIGGLNTVNNGDAQNKGTHHIMAGESVSVAESKSGAASSRHSTLVITGSGTYSFGGTLGHDNDTVEKSLSLEMNGSGSQTFNGSKAVLNNVAALQGTLNVTTTSLEIMGNLGVGKNATLNLGSYNYSLDSGKSLTISGTGATLTAGLTLNGGTLVFDAAALDQTGFNLGGTLSSSAGAVIDFTGLTTAQDGKTYTLTAGDWSSVLDTLSSANLSFMRADFGINESGNLLVTFAKNGYLWEGTDSSYTWSSTQFGTDTSAPNNASNVVFGDSATNTTVIVDGYVSAGAMYFENNSKEYLLSALPGSQISTNTISHIGSGTTVIKPWTVVKSGIDVKAGTLVLEDAEISNSTSNISVTNGKLSLGLSAKTTISALNLGENAVLDLALSGSKASLVVNTAATRTITENLSIKVSGTRSANMLNDVKSDYIVRGGSLNIGAENSTGGVLVKSVQLSEAGELNVSGGFLASANGMGFGTGISTVNINGGTVVFTDGVGLTAPQGTANISIQNGALYTAGAVASSNLRIQLGDGAILGGSNYNNPLSVYASDIELAGDATLATFLGYYMKEMGSVSAPASYGAGCLQMTGEIYATGDADLTIGSGKGGRVAISKQAVVTGAVNVAAKDFLSLTDSLIVTTETNSQTSGAQISSNSKDGSNAAVISGGSTLAWDGKNAVIRGDGKSRAVVSNSLVELYDGATLKLQNVLLASDSQIKTVADSASATIDASNVGLQVMDAEGNVTTRDSALTLNLFGTDKTYTLESGSKVLEITTDLLAGNLTLTGESLMVDFVGYDVKLYDAVQLNFASGVKVDTNMVIAAQAQVEQGTTPQLMTGSYVTGGNVGSIVFIMNHNIPEPATTTLSLLALTALAGRRRRR